MLRIKNFSIMLFLIVSVSVFAATDSANLNLTGFIGQAVDITITPEPVASSIDLAVAHTDLLVATVNEYCNVAAGYSVTLQAANGMFVHSTDGSQTVEYTVAYGSLSNANLVAGVNQIGTPAGTTTPLGGVNVPLHLSHAAALTNPGTYNETITFTITNN